MVHGENYILYNISKFLTYLSDFGLHVTERAASSELVPLMEELKKTDKDYKLLAEDAKKLNRIMEDLRKTLFAEAQGNIAFIVTDKRLDVKKLLSDIPALMAPGVFESLPDIAKHDFIQGGKCIAFGLPTAAAFHLLRGTESVLKELYCCYIKRNRSSLMWGPMVDSLRKRKKNQLPIPLLDNLDNIRRNFRNPTQHPEKIYDIQEVQDLFGLCVDVINRMVPLLNKP